MTNLIFPWITDPTTVLARTIYGEARSGGWRGMQSVANVIQNRAAHPRWWGHSILAVCLDPWQFSSWNHLTVNQPDDGNFETMVTATVADSTYTNALAIAGMAIAGKLLDITDSADSYYELGTPAPAWTAKAVQLSDIADQRFYRTV